MKIILLIFLNLFLVFNLVHALDKESEYIKLDNIVVTPYRTTIDAGISPASIEVIHIQDAKKQGKYTFTDAVKNIPSLSYATSGGKGGETSLFIRGAQSYHTQVMLDGIKLFDPISTQGYFYSSNYMALDNIERVEVAKGPYSSLYGSGSIGGTINLIPRRGKGEPYFSYFQEGGSYDTLRGILSSQGEVDDLSYAFSTSWSNIRGFYAASKDQNPEKDPYRDINTSLNLDYNFTDNVVLGLISHYTYAKYDYDGGWPVPEDADNYARFHQGIGGINLKHQINNLFSHKITTGYTRIYRKDYPESGNDSWFDGKTYQVKWQGDYQILPENKIIFGFDYLRQAGESIYEPKNTANTEGYFLENIFTPLDNLFFSASYRREEHSQFGGENTFSTGAGYRIEKTGTNINISFGQGFRAPSIYELYAQPMTYIDWFTGLPVTDLVGNPDLIPERSRSFEAGLKQDVFDNLQIGSTYFQTNIKNLIEYVDGQYQNVDKAKIYGIENFLKYNFKKDTVFKIAYTHLDATKRPEGTRLARRPNNKITSSLSKEWDKLFAYSELSYVGNRTSDTSGDVKLKSYVLANMNLGYQVNDNLELSLRLENILNRDYELIKGYQTPKFSCYLGAKVKF